MIASAINISPLAIYAQPSPASAAAARVTELLVQSEEHARKVATDWRPLANALIEELADECREPNWDGYGANAVDTAAKAQAQRFVDLLPHRLPAPDPVPDPDGEIALTWDFGPGHILTIAIGADGTLTYAGLLGGGVKRHGVERLGATIPKAILQALEELCDRVGVAA
ncbi:MAG: hypothetical protein ACREU3_01180 [Steroidobacteraceae bacterium]